MFCSPDLYSPLIPSCPFYSSWKREKELLGERREFRLFFQVLVRPWSFRMLLSSNVDIPLIRRKEGAHPSTCFSRFLFTICARCNDAQSFNRLRSIKTNSEVEEGARLQTVYQYTDFQKTWRKSSLGMFEFLDTDARRGVSNIARHTNELSPQRPCMAHNRKHAEAKVWGIRRRRRSGMYSHQVSLFFCCCFFKKKSPNPCIILYV